MLETLFGFDWLGEQFATSNQRLAVTVVAVGVLVAVLLSYQRLQEWLGDRVRPLYVDVITMGVLVGTCLLSLAIILGVWQQTQEVRDIYVELGLGAPAVARVVISAIILLSGLIVNRFTRRVIREVFASSTAVTDHQREVTHRISQVAVWSITLLVILGVWIDDLSGLLVGAGLFGAGLGMAARQTISSILAGFVLMFARPFEIGDWIEVEDSEGTVTDISIFNTRVQSFDGEYIMIPNDLIASSMVINRSKRGRLRVEIEIGIDYTSDVERASELIETTMADLDLAEAAPAPQVVSKGFGDSAIMLSARFWIDKPSARRQWQARTAAIGAIKDAFEEEGIKIPYPQRELSGRAERGGFEIADQVRGSAPAEGNGESAPDGDSRARTSTEYDERGGGRTDSSVESTSDSDDEQVATREDD
ncbi:mechanosensitive ion channel family protein [Halostagnicola bangensis]